MLFRAIFLLVITWDAEYLCVKKGFREAISKKKHRLANAEYSQVRKAYALDPPEGWTVLTFLEKMNFGEGAEEVASHFPSWNDFVASSGKDLLRVQVLNLRQRRRISQYLRLFNHGLWPDNADTIRAKFPGKRHGMALLIF